MALTTTSFVVSSLFRVFRSVDWVACLASFGFHSVGRRQGDIGEGITGEDMS